MKYYCYVFVQCSAVCHKSVLTVQIQDSLLDDVFKESQHNPLIEKGQFIMGS